MPQAVSAVMIVPISVGNGHNGATKEMHFKHKALKTGLEETQLFHQVANDLFLLALEFALAADIVRTAVAPTWDDIWKLAVIAVVRTMLNYFLAKDVSKLQGTQENQAK